MPRRFNYLEAPQSMAVELLAWELADLYKHPAPDATRVKDALNDLNKAFRWKLAAQMGTKPEDVSLERENECNSQI